MALAVIAAVGCAAYAANFMGLGDRMDAWLGSGFTPTASSTPEPPASATPSGAAAGSESAATDNGGSGTAGGKPSQAANTAESSQAESGAVSPEAAQPEEGWVSLTAVTAPDGAAGALQEGARLRIELPAGGSFSYQEWRSSPEGAAVRNDTLVASLLLETALRAGLETGERHIHAELPAGVRAGFDADVSEGRDLTFFNPHDFPVALIVTAENGTLAAEAKGESPFGWKAPTINVSSPLMLGPERVELISADGSQAGTVAGKPGMLVKVYADGRLLHKDFYPPVPVRAIRGPTEEEREAFRHDGSLS